MGKVVKRKKGEDSWAEITFPKGGGGTRSKYTTPSLRASKYGLSIYCCDDLKGDTQVKIFSNGSKVAIVPDKNGPKKLKADKKGRRISLPGKKMSSQLNLEIGKVLAGVKGEVDGAMAWIFG